MGQLKPITAGKPRSGNAARSGGLFRGVLAGEGQGVMQVFGSLGCTSDTRVTAEDQVRGTRAACRLLRPDEGHGRYDFYRVSDDLFVLGLDCIYDAPRFEFMPGEDLIEFYVKLSGRLSLMLPGEAVEVLVGDQQLLVWAQPRGVDASERIEPGLRDTSISLYCRPAFLRRLLARDSMKSHVLLDALNTLESPQRDRVWHRILPLSPTAVHISRCLLHNPYCDGLRLLYAEARALELLCEILSGFGDSVSDSRDRNERDLRRLDTARRILATQFRPVPRICDVARAVGLSESKLKRDFKDHFGVTVFDYGFECRMQHARELLVSEGLSVSEVAYAVGYSHCTSFTAAFREFFDCLPSEIRSEAKAS
jgi:AraC-like DNA-binding protein